MMFNPARQGTPVGTTFAHITITNLFTKNTTHVRALVDSGSILPSVTEDVAKSLGFDPTEFTTTRVVLADGRRISIPMIGPIQIAYEDRSCTTSAYVMGDECLLGCVPLETMDLILDPLNERLVGRHPLGPIVRL
jgi:clan AA aspartic protease